MSSRLRYLAPLDGVRALAVIGVLLFHGGVGWARGGFLGVDAFFVLSGYLITRLLVEEWSLTGRISLRRFWGRRVRRLFPALLVLLLFVCAYAVLLATPDTRHRLRLDAVATLGYVANWRLAASGTGYFDRLALPSPLQHTWSLAIEEQFYLVWPLVVVMACRRARRPLRLLLLTATGATLASAAAMAALYRPGADTSRVYYGTDTHAQSWASCSRCCWPARSPASLSRRSCASAHGGRSRRPAAPGSRSPHGHGPARPGAPPGSTAVASWSAAWRLPPCWRTPCWSRRGCSHGCWLLGRCPRSDGSPTASTSGTGRSS